MLGSAHTNVCANESHAQYVLSCCSLWSLYAPYAAHETYAGMRVFMYVCAYVRMYTQAFATIKKGLHLGDRHLWAAGYVAAERAVQVDDALQQAQHLVKEDPI